MSEASSPVAGASSKEGKNMASRTKLFTHFLMLAAPATAMILAGAFFMGSWRFNVKLENCAFVMPAN
jgi:hypothetical protein